MTLVEDSFLGSGGAICDSQKRRRLQSEVAAFAANSRLSSSVLGRVERWCKLWDISVLYTSAAGVKCLNQLISSDRLQLFVMGEPFTLKADSLFMSCDGLRDRYTLLSVPLLDSPHLELMQTMQAGGDLTKTEYALRYEKSLLHFRHGNSFGPARISHLRNWHRERLEAIRKEKYEPIKVAQVGRCYYIVDGRHTAALVALQGMTLQCMDVTTFLFDSFFLPGFYVK